jgi:glycosyltransferase involved in cell wall biosynthesis
MSRLSISAFYPCYNDAESIGDIVQRTDEVLQTLTDDYEIIVVNDGSKDRSADVLRELETRVPRLRVITHPINQGYGAALRSGFKAATKDLVFYTDGDGQYDVSEASTTSAKRRYCGCCCLTMWTSSTGSR